MSPAVNRSNNNIIDRRSETSSAEAGPVPPIPIAWHPRWDGAKTQAGNVDGTSSWTCTSTCHEYEHEYVLHQVTESCTKTPAAAIGERRAAAERRADLDVAAVRADDLVTDREAEAGAVGAGREERLEDARQVVGVDAAPVVLDLDRDAAASGGLSRAP